MLSTLDQALIGAGLTVVSSMVTGSWVWIRTAKNKVSSDECLNIREKIEENHRKLCPLNRDINVIADHDRECAQRLHPMQSEIAALKVEFKSDIVGLHNKLDRVLDGQRRAITMQDLRELIEVGLKR